MQHAGSSSLVLDCPVRCNQNPLRTIGTSGKKLSEIVSHCTTEYVKGQIVGAATIVICQFQIVVRYGYLESNPHELTITMIRIVLVTL